MNASQADPLTYLDEVDARVADCSTYNFGMRNADTVAHVDAPALSKALRAVLDLHVPDDMSTCTGCGSNEWGDPLVKYPCPTVQAIHAAIAVNDEGGK